MSPGARTRRRGWWHRGRSCRGWRPRSARWGRVGEGRELRGFFFPPRPPPSLPSPFSPPFSLPSCLRDDVGARLHGLELPGQSQAQRDRGVHLTAAQVGGGVGQHCEGARAAHEWLHTAVHSTSQASSTPVMARPKARAVLTPQLGVTAGAGGGRGGVRRSWWLGGAFSSSSFSLSPTLQVVEHRLQVLVHVGGRGEAAAGRREGGRGRG